MASDNCPGKSDKRKLTFADLDLEELKLLPHQTDNNHSQHNNELLKKKRKINSAHEKLQQQSKPILDENDEIILKKWRLQDYLDHLKRSQEAAKPPLQKVNSEVLPLENHKYRRRDHDKQLNSRIDNLIQLNSANSSPKSIHSSNSNSLRRLKSNTSDLSTSRLVHNSSQVSNSSNHVLSSSTTQKYHQNNNNKHQSIQANHKSNNTHFTYTNGGSTSLCDHKLQDNITVKSENNQDIINPHHQQVKKNTTVYFDQEKSDIINLRESSLPSFCSPSILQQPRTLTSIASNTENQLQNKTNYSIPSSPPAAAANLLQNSSQTNTTTTSNTVQSHDQPNMQDLEMHSIHNSEIKAFEDDSDDDWDDDLEKKPFQGTKQGSTIPTDLLVEMPSRKLLNVPLCEVDPFYSDTFVMIDRATLIYRFSCQKSLGLFYPSHPIRLFFLKILTSPTFNRMIMFTIIINCLAMTETKEYELLTIAEYVFLAIYTFEMLVKVVSRGFVLHQFSYLRDGLNVLDLLVVLTSYLELLIAFIYPNAGGATLKGLRALRVLRAMKAISIIPGLKNIIAALIKSCKALNDVMILTTFSLIVLSLIGMNIFGSDLKNKCVATYPGHFQNFSLKSYYPNYDWLNPPMECEAESYSMQQDSWFLTHNPFLNDGETYSFPRGSFNNATPFSYEDWINNENNYCYVEGNPLICGNSSVAGQCQPGFTCLNVGDNPDNNYTSFDNIILSFLALFNLLVQDCWDELYFQIIRAKGPHYIFFFIFSIYIISFYLLNLILAVVATEYDEQRNNESQKENMDKDLLAKKHKQLKNKLKAVQDQIKNGETPPLSKLPEKLTPEQEELLQYHQARLHHFQFRKQAEENKKKIPPQFKKILEFFCIYESKY